MNPLLESPMPAQTDAPQGDGDCLGVYHLSVRHDKPRNPVFRFRDTRRHSPSEVSDGTIHTGRLLSHTLASGIKSGYTGRHANVDPALAPFS